MSLPSPLSALAGLTAALTLAAPSPAQSYEDAKILPSDGHVGQEFGSATALGGGILAVGSRGDDDRGTDSGSAYLFDAASGAQRAKLTAHDGAAGDGFGSSIALGGGLAVVGAPKDDDRGTDSGSVYVFDAQSGAQLAKLVAPDGADGDQFGCAVAVGSGRIVVGAIYDDDHGRNSGAAYLFDTQSYALVTKVVPSDGDMDDLFGESVDIDGGIVVVGAHGDDDRGLFSGSAYLFDAADGSPLRKLTANDGSSWDFFGAAVAIDAGTVVVGAWADMPHGDNSGSAYLFDAASGSQLHKLVPSDGYYHDRFGISVAIDAGEVLVGAEGKDVGGVFDCGAVYRYDASSGALVTRLLASDAAPLDELGAPYSLAIEAGVVAAGAAADDDLGASSGSVYLYGGGGGGSPLTLSAAGSAGGPMSFTVAGATGGGLVGLVRAFGTGSHPVSNPVTGNTVVTGLSGNGFSLAQVLTADPGGTASLTTNVPSGAAGRVNVQAIDAASDRTSNVVGL